MKIDDNITDEKLQYDINREAAKILALSSGADPGLILGCCNILQKKLNIEMM